MQEHHIYKHILFVILMQLELLRKIGLSEGEVKIYTALLDLGLSPINKIHERTGIERRNIYDILNKLIERGLEVLATREPGGTDMGYKIRNILLDPDSEDLCNKAELLLYCADRAQHFEEVIKPTLASGKSILSDRGPDATLLYQGFGRGLDLK